MYDVACVGILVADAICKEVNKLPEQGKLNLINSVKLYNGGCAMSAAIDMAVLGSKTAIIGKIGDDGFGSYLKSVLIDKNVNIDGLVVEKGADTSASVVIVDSSGERSFLHCKGTNDTFSYDDVNFDVIENSRIVFVAGSMLMNKFDGEDCARVLKKAKEMGKVTALDTAWDDSGRWMEVLKPALEYVDYFIPSIEEAIELAGGECDHDKIADCFFDCGVKHVAIKVGKKGCYCRESKESKGVYIAPFIRENPVDTTGAGDSWCSGFLHGIAIGKSMEEACLIGNAVGAHIIMEVGATTGARPYEEIAKFIEENRK
ncbi:MAG: carbohydrate kinase family protein [Oscillospiraceae bacterium]|nr:carbohydrate kinase family protein [Oscillospiraceae bacterium]MBQ6901676.1 carbohydrate kinase family protein [Oscillospiraceae bacterium]